MKKVFSILLVLLLFVVAEVSAQCSICTRTAQQLGEETGKALNAGILYMAFAPIAIIFYLGYRWWKSNRIP